MQVPERKFPRPYLALTHPIKGGVGAISGIMQLYVITQENLVHGSKRRATRFLYGDSTDRPGQPTDMRPPAGPDAVPGLTCDSCARSQLRISG